uniref:hypothetical protein n=1 Tax=Amycolatopsis sp. CA-151526 TaxID=3239921 RepID=UPI003F49B25A
MSADPFAKSIVRMRRRAAELREEAQAGEEHFKPELLSVATIIANAADRAAPRFTDEQLTAAAAELDAEPADDEDDEDELS